MDVKNIAKPIDESKSIKFADVLMIQPAVKFVRAPSGKGIVPNTTATLSRNCTLEQLKISFSLILPMRFPQFFNFIYYINLCLLYPTFRYFITEHLTFNA